MKHGIVVGTHHKTGTVWMDGVFKAVARDVGVQYVNFRSQYGRLNELLKNPFILLNDASDFGEYAHILEREDVRILHVVRDPRDVLISAMHYHQRSSESWLHAPVPGYERVTYQRTLRALATTFEQYVFEMEHSTCSTLRGMQNWDFGRPNCFEARYEDLRQDVDMGYWHRVANFLGFEKAELQLCARRFWQNSLFGGLSRFGNKHIRSGNVAQWRTEFTVELAYAFIGRFPTALQSLGYERNNHWIAQLSSAHGRDAAGQRSARMPSSIRKPAGSIA